MLGWNRLCFVYCNSQKFNQHKVREAILAGPLSSITSVASPAYISQTKPGNDEGQRWRSSGGWTTLLSCQHPPHLATNVHLTFHKPSQKTMRDRVAEDLVAVPLYCVGSNLPRSHQRSAYISQTKPGNDEGQIWRRSGGCTTFFCNQHPPHVATNVQLTFHKPSLKTMRDKVGETLVAVPLYYVISTLLT